MKVARAQLCFPLPFPFPFLSFLSLLMFHYILFLSLSLLLFINLFSLNFFPHIRIPHSPISSPPTTYQSPLSLNPPILAMCHPAILQIPPPTYCTFSSLNFPFSSSPSSLYAPYPHIPPPFSLHSPTALPFPRSFPPLLSPLYSCTKDSCWSKNPGSQMAVVVLYTILPLYNETVKQCF